MQSKAFRTTLAAGLFLTAFAALPASANPLVDDTYGILNCSLGLANQQLGIVAQQVNFVVGQAERQSGDLIRRTKCLVMQEACTLHGFENSQQTCRTAFGATTIHIASEGQVVNRFCAGGEVMEAKSPIDLLFPGAGCAARFSSMAAQAVVLMEGHVVYSGTGASTVCGYFSISGGYSGSTARRCAAAGQQIDAPLLAHPTGQRDFTLTWHPDVSWQNAMLNEIVIITV